MDMEDLKKETEDQLQAFSELEKRLSSDKIQFSKEDLDKRVKMRELAKGLFSVEKSKQVFEKENGVTKKMFLDDNNNEMVPLSEGIQEDLFLKAQHQILETKKISY
mmetsp:Transcript_32350/g.28644  ORF Transcript_32350/g.28644 Transcript_32350/m.28644 type:complete len:106 (+) Transcript_32350:190-507(+)